MSRRHRAEKRAVTPDTRYGNDMVGRLINSMMERGKKSIAERIVYTAFDQIAQTTKEDPLQVFTQAIDNVKPRLEVKSRRVGGATYQVPVEVSSERQVALALRWILDYAKGRKGVSMPKALARAHRYSDWRSERPMARGWWAPRCSAQMGKSACSTPCSDTYTLTNNAEPMESAASEACAWRPATMVSVTP